MPGDSEPQAVGLIGKTTEGTTPWEREINVLTGLEYFILVSSPTPRTTGSTVLHSATIEAWVPWLTLRSAIYAHVHIFPVRSSS